MKSLIRTALTAIVVSGSAGGALADAEPNVAVTWNEEMLSAIEQNPPAPTVTCRRMYMVWLAMYDAYCAYDPASLSPTWIDALRRPSHEHTDENRAKAISYAAYRMLTYHFPNQEHQFRLRMRALGFRLMDTTDPTTPEGIGNLCAATVIDHRTNDGSNWQNGYVDTTSEMFPRLYEPTNDADPESRRAPGGNKFDPNRWQPLRVPNGTLLDNNGVPVFDNDDPTTYFDQTFLTPHWGNVTPFALTSGDQFRPGPPPIYGSNRRYEDARGREMSNHDAYVWQFTQILRYSENLTDREKVIAEFWADGPRSYTPPGHWNQLAHGIAFRDNLSVGDCVKMFFALNGALLDASIVAWEAKRVYDSCRPQSGIRHLFFGQMVRAWGGPNQGTQTILGEEWQPYQAATFVTPPFGEYISGHSTFSRASREVLKAFSGSDRLYDGVTVLDTDYDGDGELDMLGQHIVLPGGNMFEDSPSKTITLRWRTMKKAANEAGISRRYGGIHIQDGDLRARLAGRKVGRQAWVKANAYINPQEGDLDIDGDVDEDDYDIFLRVYYYGDAYSDRADFDNDGDIDDHDLLFMIGYVG